MNAKYSLTLLTTVCFSIAAYAGDAHAQMGRVVIDPMPYESENIVEEPSQADLMEPIDVQDMQARQEKAILDNIVVPEPGSSYFDDQEAVTAPEPLPMDEADVQAPMDESLDLPIVPDNVQEYERWVAEQKAKYRKKPARDAVMPIQVDIDPPPMPDEAVVPDTSIPKRPTVYSSEGRLSASPEMTKQVEEMGVDTPKMQPLAAQTDWNALEGSSIRQVLDGWCKKAGVELIWRSESDFAVLNPFVMRSTFERAVQKLLDQYQDNQVRPLATLHVDPESGKKTLVVRVAEGQ